MASGITADSSRYCFLDIDLNNHRAKLATAAAFVNATDSRYGFSSKDLRHLGGSEVKRVHDLIGTDHEWMSKGEIETKPPTGGNRILVELFWDTAPLAAENFATLCANGSVLPLATDKKPKPVPIGSSGKSLSYRGSTMHRCIPGFVLQGGDFVLGNGSGGESIFNGKKFKDERAGLQLKHERGSLSMGNSGKNSNSSQFFFPFQAAPQCDGKHVVFGRILSGLEVLDAAEKYGTSQGEPTVPICITDCGVFAPFHTPGAGYWYDQPDEDSFSGVSPVFMVFPRVAVLAPNEAVLDKFRKAMTDKALITCISGEELSEESMQIERIQELLGTFAVDVILVAPVCRDMIPKLTLPQSWTDTGISIGEVVMEAKPVESLAAVRAKSWLSKKEWRLE